MTPSDEHKKSGRRASGEHSPLLFAGTSQLVVIDVQARLAEAMPASGLARLEGALRLLATATSALGVPTTITEHVPAAIGTTVPWVRAAFADATVVEKVHFAATAVPTFVERLQRFDRRQVIVAGMECHVCVLQATLDLVARGFQVYLAVDAAISRDPYDEAIAHARARDHDVELVTSEMVAFEWLRRADHPARRQIIEAIKAKDAVTRGAAPVAPP